MLSKRFSKNLSAFLALAVCGSLVFMSLGCHKKSKAPKASKYARWSNAQLYTRGLKSFRKKHYPQAEEFFGEILKRRPDAEFTPKSMLRLADSYYREKGVDSYVSAVLHYGDFLRAYPRDARDPYAQYQIGMCYFKQILSAERDPQNTYDAQDAFQKVVKLYPESVHAISAKHRIWQCRKSLAEHEFIVARFYYNQGKFEAAVNRFRKIESQYPDYPHGQEFLFFSGDALWILKQKSEGQKYFDELIKRYPKSKYTKEAKLRIKGKPNHINFWNRVLPPYL